MTTATAVRAPRKRRGRARTKTVSAREPISVSALHPLDVNMYLRGMSLVCPDCRTWVPITGKYGATPKLVPHDTTPYGAPGAGRRCTDGSNRAIVLDLTVEHWERRVRRAVEDGCDPATRHGTALVKRPAPKTPAVSQILRPAETAAAAWNAYRTHRDNCAACTRRRTCPDASDLEHRENCTACTPRRTCPEGARLAEIYTRRLRQEPSRRAALDAQAHHDHAYERAHALLRAATRSAQWTETAPAVERADSARATIPDGTVLATYAPGLPGTPKRKTSP
ncbi:hypothetical protein [Streptomyces sp. NPDC049879]|uniref:hypothetical protein n=1 Tax=Streptomyces sp. NPDC049879 TaxID=3365598 RepID=UPI00378CBEBD